MQVIAIVVFFMLATSSVSAVAITQQETLDENLQKNSDVIYPEKKQSQVIESYDIRVFDGFNLGDIDTQQDKILVKEKFHVLPYINADPILARRLEEAGCSTVMPLASPIGANNGIRTKEMIKIIIEQSNIPVVIDAGLGAPSDA